MADGESDLSTSNGKQPIELPSPPQTLAAIVEAASDPNISPVELSRLVACDPSFSARILAMVNSPIYQRGSKVNSVPHAIGVLGSRQLRNLALCAAAQACVNKDELGDFDLRRFWENSLRRAVACKILAETVLNEGRSAPDANLRADEKSRTQSKESSRVSDENSDLANIVDPLSAFTAGLLQDLGVLVLIKAHPDRATQWMEHKDENPDERRDAESSIFALRHDDVATELSNSWNLPEDLATAMHFHHKSADAPKGHRLLCQICEAAEYLAYVLSAPDPRQGLEYARLELADRLLMTRPQVDAAVTRVSQEVAHTAGAIGIKVRRQPSLRSIREQAFDGLMRMNMSYEQLVSHLEASLRIQDKLTQELAAQNAELERQARTDSLTGLPNRRAIWERLMETVDEIDRGGCVSFLLVDVDHFKRINDTRGYDVGDFVLEHLGQVMAGTLGQDTLLARMGGEEFGVLLSPGTRIEPNA